MKKETLKKRIEHEMYILESIKEAIEKLGELRREENSVILSKLVRSAGKVNELMVQDNVELKKMEI